MKCLLDQATILSIGGGHLMKDVIIIIRDNKEFKRVKERFIMDINLDISGGLLVFGRDASSKFGVQG